MADKPKEVTINNNDIVDLANDLSKTGDDISQGGMEYFIKEWLRRVKGVDFFPEEMK